MNVAPPQEKKAARAGCKKHEHNAGQRGKIINIPYIPEALEGKEKLVHSSQIASVLLGSVQNATPTREFPKQEGELALTEDDGLTLGMVTPKMPQQIPVEHWKQINICNSREKRGKPNPAQQEFSTTFLAGSLCSLSAGIRDVGEGPAPLPRSH